MTTVESLGAILLALGALCLFGARVIEAIFRLFVDRKIESKEDEVDEAGKNSASSYAEYQRLKSEYDAKGDK